jgi:hypothetical protein
VTSAVVRGGRALAKADLVTGELAAFRGHVGALGGPAAHGVHHLASVRGLQDLPHVEAIAGGEAGPDFLDNGRGVDEGAVHVEEYCAGGQDGGGHTGAIALAGEGDDNEREGDDAENAEQKRGDPAAALAVEKTVVARAIFFGSHTLSLDAPERGQ